MGKRLKGLKKRYFDLHILIHVLQLSNRGWRGKERIDNWQLAIYSNFGLVQVWRLEFNICKSPDLRAHDWQL